MDHCEVFWGAGRGSGVRCMEKYETKTGFMFSSMSFIIFTLPVEACVHCCALLELVCPVRGRAAQVFHLIDWFWLCAHARRQDC